MTEAQTRIGQLFEGPLDIIGDVHGEHEALDTLLADLGYAPDGSHPEGRRMVFVGDLVDRGPDSVAVVDRVSEWMAAGVAQCVLGNHEFNLLMGYRRHGNGWFHGDSTGFDSRVATPEAQRRVLRFVEALPIALHRADLRVVHACWDSDAISTLATLEGSLAEVDRGCAEQVDEHLHREGLLDRARAEYHAHREALHDAEAAPPMLHDLASKDWRRQMGSPIRVLTSGQEGPIQTPFFASGKWRMVGRVPWWDHYPDQVPVVIGHYWRSSTPQVGPARHDPLAAIAPFAWMGPQRSIFCVDYGVGRRHDERRRGVHPFRGRLAALRLPEWTVHFDDGEQRHIGPPGL